MSDLGNKEVFANNLNMYINRTGRNKKEICKELGFKYTTFIDWCNGRTYPRIDSIEQIASYFNIEKSDLIERRDNANDKRLKMRLLGALADKITLNDIDLIEKVIEHPRKEELIKRLNTYIVEFDKKSWISALCC